MNSRLNLLPFNDTFHRLENGNFIFSKHTRAKYKAEKNYVNIARKFIGSPYKWGGRTSLGIDCSGLLQTSLIASGINCPRDTIDQVRIIGNMIGINCKECLLIEGDIIFWIGHVGIYIEPNKILHSNMSTMDTREEHIDDVIFRYEKANLPISSIRRIVNNNSNST
tara:strand:- start:77731 stop:78228 length:498 start_codon:yes stop_codon:yes gene_type:complete